ncbi:hypothetical protein [Methanoculleus sp. 7T]|uniref:hypothetical protein n=1 Tax=Methanoculleus sp. 7T TaxID=2937282 RepID=UPI0020BF00AB|nr:hypothetical protein [Methanoculleus sp. 7T]MCK8518970.1 hypothetical protein [Methanoculleus sp. 7T]
MVDENAGAIITVFVLGVVTVLHLLGAVPARLVLIFGLFAVVLLLAIGLLVLGEIRDGMRDAR